MIVWTIQTEKAYQKLLRTDFLYGDWRRVWKCFKTPYKWLCEQMEARDIPLHGRPPIWAWAHKSDLRHSGFAAPKQRFVRLEVELPDHLGLASNFEAWHCVLNNFWFGEEDSDTVLYRPHDEVVASWQGIFDLVYCSKIGYNSATQITFPSIDITFVREARPFVSR